MLENLYTQRDFTKLTVDDINNICRLMGYIIEKEYEKTTYLYEKLDEIQQNADAIEYVNKKVLAGRMSVKWYSFDYNESFTQDKLEEILHSEKVRFGVNVKEVLAENIVDDIVGTAYENGIYTLKILLSDGYQLNRGAAEYTKYPKYRNVIVKVSTVDRWIEVRTNEQKCKTVCKLLERKLGINELVEKRILRNYGNDFNLFKTDLCNGFYQVSHAIPAEEIKLTSEDAESLGGIINAIDEYLSNGDFEMLKESLENITFDAEGLSTAALFLAGMSSVGFKIRKNSEADISMQTLYRILKGDLIDDIGFFTFSLEPCGIINTIQIGKTSNSVVFKNSVTEDVVEYIRNKIL